MAALFASTLLAPAATAVDGVLEINQTCAEQTGCFTGDTPGFPVTITTGGSYRLTSNLERTGGSNIAVSLNAPDVTLDLAGFSILGLGDLSSQIGVWSGFSGCIVRNGRVTGFVLGVSLAAHARVEDLLVRDVSAAGISVTKHGHVLGNTVSGGSAFGIRAGDGSYVTNNAVMNVSGTAIDLGAGAAAHANAISNAGEAFAGAVLVGTNLCDGDTCGAPPMRRYYLTQQIFYGNEARTACADGFHMASLWEIKETSALRYDTTLGQNWDDNGSGPPADPLGWVRTGRINGYFGDGAGADNCLSYTSGSGYGTVVAPGSNLNWDTQAVNTAAPDDMNWSHYWAWSSTISECYVQQRVWCVQD